MMFRNTRKNLLRGAVAIFVCCASVVMVPAYVLDPCRSSCSHPRISLTAAARSQHGMFSGGEEEDTHESRLSDVCAELGCTIADYRRTTQQLRLRAKELSEELRRVQDEAHRRRQLEAWKILYHHDQQQPKFRHGNHGLWKIPGAISFPASAGWWWKALRGNGPPREIPDEPRGRPYVLEGRLARLSDRLRALRILLVSLEEVLKVGEASDRGMPVDGIPRTPVVHHPRPTHAIGDASHLGGGGRPTHRIAEPSSGKRKPSNHHSNDEPLFAMRIYHHPTELAAAYRRIVRTECLELPAATPPPRSTTAPATPPWSRMVWASRALGENLRSYRRLSRSVHQWLLPRTPRPPRGPPTNDQFLHQCRQHRIHSNRPDDEGCTREWFGKTRVASHPFPTALYPPGFASGHNRATTHPWLDTAVPPDAKNATVAFR